MIPRRKQLRITLIVVLTVSDFGLLFLDENIFDFLNVSAYQCCKYVAEDDKIIIIKMMMLIKKRVFQDARLRVPV